MNISEAQTVRDLALDLPSATRIFEKLGIDYCCGGHRSLRDACTVAKVSLDDVVAKLEAAEKQPVPDNTQRNWQNASLPELVDHILSTHHEYLKEELPRLEQLLAKVCGVHGEGHPELKRIQSTYHDLAQELESHMMKEEQILFPYIAQVCNGIQAHSCFGTVQNPIRMMMFEHDNAGAALREIRGTSRNFELPADACVSYQTLYKALQAFEADLHQHIHLENNILFPRTIALEEDAA